MALDYQLDYQLTARNFSKQGHRGPVTFLVPSLARRSWVRILLKASQCFLGFQLLVVSC